MQKIRNCACFQSASVDVHLFIRIPLADTLVAVSFSQVHTHIHINALFKVCKRISQIWEGTTASIVNPHKDRQDMQTPYRKQ